MTNPTMKHCPTCGSTDKAKRMLLVYQEPYGHQELCPDPWHTSASVAKPIDSSTRYDDMDMGYRQSHNK